ncbi:MAG: YraN family protein [Johnsonella sp.]|nr:YraN family protein [Johnsonella sp.]
MEEKNKKNKREIGAFYEERAEEFLKERKVLILEKNYRTRRAEIDLIGIEGLTLVFFEVKFRSRTGMGYPLEAVDQRKREKIRSAARQYIAREKKYGMEMRFDCIGILGEEIEWIRNAF